MQSALPGSWHVVNTTGDSIDYPTTINQPHISHLIESDFPKSLFSVWLITTDKPLQIFSFFFKIFKRILGILSYI